MAKVELEKLSEKGYEQRSEHGFGRYKEGEGAEESVLGGPQSCAIDASYEAWREGDHDDLVLAVAMACWCGERYLRKETSRPRPGILADEGVPMNVIGRRS
jgi:hypothetical protein